MKKITFMWLSSKLTGIAGKAYNTVLGPAIDIKVQNKNGEPHQFTLVHYGPSLFVGQCGTLDVIEIEESESVNQ